MAAVAEEAAKGGGGFHPVQLLTAATEAAITGLHDLLSSMGVPSAYGISIICFTIFVKTITFPLTYQQLASTTKMQTLGPKVNETHVCDTTHSYGEGRGRRSRTWQCGRDHGHVRSRSHQNETGKEGKL